MVMIQSKGMIRIDKDFDHYQTSLQTPSEESWGDKSTNKVSNMLSMHSQFIQCPSAGML